MDEVITSLLFFLIFTGFWIGFIFLIFRFLIKRYEEKPLEYIPVKKVNEYAQLSNEEREK